MNENIKVFISSTFRDLNNERDYLIKHVFPEIREKLDGIMVSEIDLRWGITEQQAREGRVIDLCLRYLIESKPFFVGILGERYGSTMENESVTLSPLVQATFPFAADHIREGKSITEIEILNGVLDNPEELDACFFIKNTDAPAPDEDKCSFEKLRALKERVSSQTRYPVYQLSRLEDLDQLIEFVEKRVKKELHQYDYKYKNQVGDDYTYNSRLENARRLRHFSQEFIPNEEMLFQISDCVEKEGTEFLLRAERGSGKSTLISYLANPKRSVTGRHFVFLYGNVAEWPLIPMHFCQFFFKIAKGMLEEDYGPFSDERWMIHQLFRTKWCFVLDNIDVVRHVGDKRVLRMADVIQRFADQAKEFFHWELDYKILYVASEGDWLINELSMDRELKILRLNMENAFSPIEYIHKHLSVYSKGLSPGQEKLLLSSPVSSNPQSLELLLDYMKDNIAFEQIDSFLHGLKNVQNSEDIVGLYIDEVLKDCKRPDVYKLLTLLGTYPSGLSRKDLQECMKIEPLSFNIMLSNLRKFFETDYFGRYYFKNRYFRDLLFHSLNVDVKDFSTCARQTFNYFKNEMDPGDLVTQEDFIIATGKHLHLKRHWKFAIPGWIKYAIPVQSESEYESKRLLFGKAMADSLDVDRQIRHCGGYSYENSFMAYLSFRSEKSFGLSEIISKHMMKRAEISEEERVLIEKQVAVAQRVRNPFEEDVLHVIESCLGIKDSSAYKYLDNLLSNPPYANRVLFSETFFTARKLLISSGYPLKNERVQKNTLFPYYGFKEVCLAMGYPEEANYYYAGPSPLYSFTYPDPDEAVDGTQKNVKFERFQNGAYYGNYGMFKSLNGQGCYVWGDENKGNMYIGIYKHNRRSGRGVFYYKDGSIYDGEWAKDKKNGMGRLYMRTDGTVYEGEFRDNEYHGQGTFYYADGLRYEGSFRDGQFDGHGKYIWPNGIWFEGEYVQGVRQGRGEQHWPDGTWIEGVWENDKLVSSTRKNHFAEIPSL